MTRQLHMLWPESPEQTPDWVLPDGYAIRPLRDGDESAHVRVMREAGFTNWTEAELERWRRSIALPDGIFVAVEAGTGDVVATALASRRPTDVHPSGGELGWVAADSAHQGKGLGMAVSFAALRRLIQAGCRRIYLLTDDYRLPAIKTYLKMGFVPFLYADDMERRWQSVTESLGWPVEPDTWVRAPDDRWVREQTEETSEHDRVNRRLEESA